MKDDDLIRYSRHILLPEIDYSGQKKITASHVLIIGAGGLGSPAAIYLAASGVGKITICDFDSVDLSNLQRQILHQDNSVGTNKAFSAKKTLNKVNPHIEIISVKSKLNISSDEVIDIMIRMTKKEYLLLTTMAFGKYRGKTFEEVTRIDAKYLDWIIDADFTDDVKYTCSVWL